MLAGKVAVVAGYGDVGKGVSFSIYEDLRNLILHHSLLKPSGLTVLVS